MQVTLSFKEGATQDDIIAQFNAVFQPNTVTSSPSAHYVNFASIGGGGSGPATPYPTLHVDDNPASGAPSAAEVFGGTAPNVAPASAGAAPSPTAPGAPILTLSVPGSTMPALPPGPAVIAQPTNAAPSNPANGVELDANGLPWDARIHSSNHEKTQKNEWRMKRNVDKALVVQVEAELRHVLSLSSPGVSAVVAVPSQQTVYAPAQLDPKNGPVLAAQVPGLPPGPPVAAPVDPYSALMIWIGGEIAAGRLTQEKVNMTCQLWGLVDTTGAGSITQLANRPDWLQPFKDALFPIPAGML